ncbi:MAG: helix-turn-helix domain-containing protein [Lachnospiraceae bacterium]|nr:helix-turn-helix domain-containing protein [Lachnospiraceae bacterium]
MIKDLGNKLKTCRIQNQYSRKQVAELVGISVSMVGLYESGERLPSLPVLVKLAHLYKVSTDYLLGVTAYNNDTLSLTGLTENQVKAVKLTVDCFRMNK